MNKYLIIFILASVVVITACSTEKPVQSGPELTAAWASCNNLGGAYNSTYKECAGISKEQCDSINGTFNECASACRHNPKATVCTMQCVIVCNVG